MKRKFDLGLAVEGDKESRRGSTMTDEHEKAKRRKTRTEAQTGTADAEDSFLLPTLRESNLHAATAGKSILKPERSSHRTTTPNPFGNPMNPAFDANPSSDDGDKATLQGVDRSIKQIEHTGRQVVTTLKERGDKYKQLLLEKQKQVSGLRLEKAEGARELAEARMRINTLEHKNRQEEEKIAELVTAVEKAESRWRLW